MLTNEQFLLIKLAEECQEVAQRALKAAQFGLDEVQVGTSTNNADRLEEELDDLFGILRMMKMEDVFTFEPDPNALREKARKVEKYRQYSRDLGLVQ